MQTRKGTRHSVQGVATWPNSTRPPCGKVTAAQSAWLVYNACMPPCKSTAMQSAQPAHPACNLSAGSARQRLQGSAGRARTTLVQPVRHLVLLVLHANPYVGFDYQFKVLIVKSMQEGSKEGKKKKPTEQGWLTKSRAAHTRDLGAQVTCGLQSQL